MSDRNEKSRSRFGTICKVVSGGQTGVDRAALDAAIATGIPIGGWCPRGRRSEDGQVPDQYPLSETPARSYSVRTEWNVRDSDGTLIVVIDEISGGTKLTLDVAKRLRKPVFVARIAAVPATSTVPSNAADHETTADIIHWLSRHEISTLNVAGPRASSNSDLPAAARRFLNVLFDKLNSGDPCHE